MKTKIFLVTLVISLFSKITLAQFPSNMNDPNMQQMMGALQEMASCFQQIDQAELEALQKRSETKVKEIQNLCSAGKRSQAQDKAIAYAKDILNEKTFKKIQACAEKIPPSLKSMAQIPVNIKEYDINTNRHVCDQP